MSRKEAFEIIDTTLRDGEQSAGVVFSEEEKSEMVKTMDQAGIKWIEAGIPAMGERECKILKNLLKLPVKSNLIAWNRANLNDLKASIDCGFRFIHISLPVSDLHIEYKLQKNREWVLKQLETCLSYLRSYCVIPIVGAEDASRADTEFFLEYADTAAKYGALRIRYADTIGCLDHFMTFRKLEDIVKRCPLPVEFHGHNDFGLALANTLAAFKAGAGSASVTATGIGERAGNAALEETATALLKYFDYDCGIKMEVLPFLTAMVEKASRRTLYSYRPVLSSQADREG